MQKRRKRKHRYTITPEEREARRERARLQFQALSPEQRLIHVRRMVEGQARYLTRNLEP